MTTADVQNKKVKKDSETAIYDCLKGGTSHHRHNSTLFMNHLNTLKDFVAFCNLRN